MTKASEPRVALITGSGRGIGAETAKLFASKGYAVCVNYRSRRDAAEAVLASIEEQGGQAICVQADVAELSEIENLFATIDRELGRINVLVNNASILSTQMRLVDMSAERINGILRNNITSYFLCAQQAIKRMSVTSGGVGGAIVNVSSRAAVTGSPGEYIDYAASKAAIDALTVGLAKEIASDNIRVNAVRPGLIHTDIHADGGEAGRVERLKSRVPLQRGGTCAEVAQAIYWLASENSSYSTGTFIDVSGGL